MAGVNTLLYVKKKKEFFNLKVPRPTGETRLDLQELWSNGSDGRTGRNNYLPVAKTI